MGVSRYSPTTPSPVQDTELLHLPASRRRPPGKEPLRLPHNRSLGSVANHRLPLVALNCPPSRPTVALLQVNGCRLQLHLRDLTVRPRMPRPRDYQNAKQHRHPHSPALRKKQEPLLPRSAKRQRMHWTRIAPTTASKSLASVDLMQCASLSTMLLRRVSKLRPLPLPTARSNHLSQLDLLCFDAQSAGLLRRKDRHPHRRDCLQTMSHLAPLPLRRVALLRNGAPPVRPAPAPRLAPPD